MKVAVGVSASPQMANPLSFPRHAPQWPVFHCAQGIEAGKQLQRIMAEEAAAITEISQLYGAVITPHQTICGELAAWPQVVSLSRLVRYLGA